MAIRGNWSYTPPSNPYPGGSSSLPPALQAAAASLGIAATPMAGGQMGKDYLYGIAEQSAKTPIRWGTTTSPSPYQYDREIPRDYVQATLTEDTRDLLKSAQAWYDPKEFDGDQFQMIQAAMINRGFLNGKGFTGMGDRWDEKSYEAWVKVLNQAGKSESTIWEVLGGKDRESFFAGKDGIFASFAAKMTSLHGGPKRDPLKIELTDPDDLKTQARSVALSTLGYTPTDDFLDEFVGVYQGMESGAQRKNYQAAATGGKVTRPGDVKVEAEKKLQADYSTEAAGFATVRAFQDMMDIMGAEQ